MVKTSVTLLAQTIMQFDAGVHEAVREGGNLYILLQQEKNIGEQSGYESDTPKTPKAQPAPVNTPKATPVSAPEKSVAVEEKEATSTSYTLDELMDMETEELFTILEGMGIDPSKFEGKNTHKKLRMLILDAGKNSVADDTAPATSKQDESAGEYTEIPEDDWEDLEEGEKVFARLMSDGVLEEKMWECDVKGWKTPKGSKAEYLHVLFLEDGQEDYLREGDKLYSYNSGL